MGYVIRPTSAADAAACRDLRLEAIRTNQTAFTTSYEENLARDMQGWAVWASPKETGCTFAADAESALVGMAGIYHTESEKLGHNGIIWGVYIRPEWRGRGILDALIDACMTWARAKELPIVKLSVVANNSRALQAYLRAGFQLYGVEPDAVRWEGVSYDELLLYRRT